MPKYYYIIDDDGGVYKTTDAKAARQAALDTAIVVDPSRNEVWIDDDTLEIEDYELPQEDDDEDDEDSDD